MTEDYLKFQSFENRESLRDHYIVYPSLETTITSTKKKREREREKEKTILQENVY